MARQEIEKRIEELEDILWRINMVDRWTNEDWKLRYKCLEEIRTLREKL